MFCDRLDVENSQRVPLQLFGIVRLFFQIFFSPKGLPFNFFDILQQIGCLKSQRVPPSGFRHCEIFFSKICFFSEGSPFNCDKIVDNFESVPLLASQSVHFFEYCKIEYLTFGRFLLFSSPGYGADLGRSRLVTTSNYQVILNV